MPKTIISDPKDSSSRSRRAVAKRYIKWACHELDMSPPEMGRLAGYAPNTINDYLRGRRSPSRTFLLDFLDKAPTADVSFQNISPLLGIRRGECPRPSKYRKKPLAEYLAAVRVSLRRTRDQFAAKLGLPVDRVYDVEHGTVPNQDYLLRLARILPGHVTVDDIIATFPVLRPTTRDLDIHRSLEELRLYPKADSRRRRLENAFVVEVAPDAKRMALSAASRLRRPEYAEEVWGEGVFLTMQRHDPKRGLFLAYLNANIRGLVQDLVRSTLHTGTITILQDYGTAVRDAEEQLFNELSRTPTHDEIAKHLDLRPSLIGEVKRAEAACVHVGSDDLDFLLQYAVDIVSPSVAADDDIQIRRLRGMPAELREVVFLHFHDHLTVPQIMAETGLPKDAVIETVQQAIKILLGDPGPDDAARGPERLGRTPDQLSSSWPASSSL